MGQFQISKFVFPWRNITVFSQCDKIFVARVHEGLHLWDASSGFQNDSPCILGWTQSGSFVMSQNNIISVDSKYTQLPLITYYIGKHLLRCKGMFLSRKLKPRSF